MKKSLVFLSLILVLSGCIQTETRIKVKKDGSGTIEKFVLMRADVVEMLASMQAFDPSKKDTGIMDEAELRADAVNLGEGVLFKSATPLKTSAGEGYKVVYTFKDVNKIKVSQTPGAEIPSADMGGGEKQGSGEYLSFNFKKGGTADLRIRLYQTDESPSADDADDEDDDDDMDSEVDEEQMDPGMLEQFYRDMKFSIFVEVEGTVVDTDADYRKGSVISLVHVDFSTLMKDPNALKSLTEGKVETLEEMKAFMKKFPGIELESKEDVRIRFR